MKLKLLIIGLFLGYCSAASAQITDTSILRSYINANIVPNSTRSITATQLSISLNGLLNVLGRYKVDSIWVNTSGDTLNYRRGLNVYRIKIGGASATHAIDSVIYDTANEKLSFRYTTGEYLHLSIKKPAVAPVQPIVFICSYGNDGLSVDGMNYVNPLLIGAAVQSVRIEADELIRVKNLGDSPDWDEWDFDPLTGTIYFGSPLPTSPSYAIRITITYLK
ncbi:hypothetical protein [Chitinophaga sp. sic0106]|uniref:hypothetical protein n=1 Tax=Chitinophaga sp. sic0106 TaxID=2854785 RepID=UPI001C47EBFB|nr:hypothetical protein [Chitinophaga sp. sic0106]MBV7529048.1 hypothetical protein [Chitinophaga sp. sic0106]